MWHSFCFASAWKIAPNCWRVLPKITFRRRLGTNTTWYLQSHLEWAKLWYRSDIGSSSCWSSSHLRRILLLERSNPFKSHWSNQWLTNFSYARNGSLCERRSAIGPLSFRERSDPGGAPLARRTRKNWCRSPRGI